jgi:hypothetical protein
MTDELTAARLDALDAMLVKLREEVDELGAVVGRIAKIVDLTKHDLETFEPRTRAFKVGDEVRVRPGTGLLSGELGEVRDVQHGLCLVLVTSGEGGWLRPADLEHVLLR